MTNKVRIVIATFVLILTCLLFLRPRALLEPKQSFLKFSTEPLLAVNIVNQSMVIRHHQIFEGLPRHTEKVDKDNILELGGLRVPAIYDCTNFNGGTPWGTTGYDYYEAIPSRWVACNYHKYLVDSGIRYTAPLLPPIDEEYVEHLSVYHSVLRARGSFVMAELGARWGTWGARAATMARTVRPELEVNLFYAETLEPYCEGLKRVHAMNNITGYTLQCSEASKESILKWASDFTHVDLLDVDIQSGESTLMPELISFLNEKVYRVIIGTHTQPIHDQINRLFWSWIKTWELPYQVHVPAVHSCISRARPIHDWEAILKSRCYFSNERFGPFINWDGELVFDNPKFVDAAHHFDPVSAALVIDDLLP